MKIECRIHREGGTLVDMPDGTQYHFAPESEFPGARHVAEVIDQKHIDILLGIPEGYRALEGDVPKAAEPAQSAKPRRQRRKAS